MVPLIFPAGPSGQSLWETEKYLTSLHFSVFLVQAACCSSQQALPLCCSFIMFSLWVCPILCSLGNLNSPSTPIRPRNALLRQFSALQILISVDCSGFICTHLLQLCQSSKVSRQPFSKAPCTLEVTRSFSTLLCCLKRSLGFFSLPLCLPIFRATSAATSFLEPCPVPTVLPATLVLAQKSTGFFGLTVGFSCLP